MTKLINEQIVEHQLRTFDAEPTPTDVVQRLNESFAESLAGLPEFQPVRTSRRRWLGAGLAAAIVFALAIGLLPTRDRAWGQVVRAVAERPWMRLTLNMPPMEKPPAEPIPTIVMWLSGDGKVAAGDFPHEKSWIDLGHNEQWSFHPENTTIRRGAIEVHAREDIQLMTTLMNCFEAPVAKAGLSRITLVEQKKESVVEDGKRWDRFTFAFDYADTSPKRNTFIIDANPDTHQPGQLRIIHGNPSKDEPVARFIIDYPQDGPGNIYALGVPRTALVIDSRSIDKVAEPLKRPSPVDFEAMVIMCLANRPLDWINEATRIRHNAAGTIVEHADLEQILRLSEDVHYGKRAPSKTPPVTWWVQEVDRLKFEPADAGAYEGGFNGPHLICYAPFGAGTDFDSMEPAGARLNGLEHTIVLRGPKRSIWRDPQRDMIVRRSEYVDEDGMIHVDQIDDVLQDPKGNWFAIKWRRGCVAERGAPLSAELDGKIATTQYFAEIKFLESSK